MKDVFFIIKELKETYRYQIIEKLCKLNNLDSYGGKWAHSLMHYINILKNTNVIRIEKRKFGKKKSFGTIVRDVYVYNPKIEEWNLPYRPQFNDYYTNRIQINSSAPLQN